MRESDFLAQGISKLGLKSTGEQISLILQHLTLLQKWNKVHNLTSIFEMDNMIKMHVFDSLSISNHLVGSSFLDIGTGAGFPGVPLAILNPQQNFVLLDSNAKKCQFLLHIKNELNLDNVSVVQSRAEGYSAENKFDGILTRAMSSVEWVYCNTRHLLARNGSIYMMLAIQINIPDEIKKLSELKKLKVPFVDATRNLLVIKDFKNDE